jgi:hypothetical protein
MGSRGRTLKGNSIVIIVEICHSTYVRVLREVFRAGGRKRLCIA